MIKKKYTYTTEHILTIENLRLLIGMFILGIGILIGAFYLGDYLLGVDCCKGGSACDTPSAIGLVLLWIFEAILVVIGIALVFNIFVDDNGNKIKVRKEIDSQSKQETKKK